MMHSRCLNIFVNHDDIEKQRQISIMLEKLQEWFVKLISPIRWKQRNNLTSADKNSLRALLTHDYFVICIRRSNYLTAFFISLGHFFLTGRWGYYTHTMMNLEDEVKSDDDFRIIEATTVGGTQYSTFDAAFDEVNAVALIKPHSMTLEEWTACLDRASTFIGVPYDNLFDLKSTNEINCVELIRLALQALPDYETRFANFEKLVSKKKYLTPHMFAECKDFHIYHVVKR